MEPSVLSRSRMMGKKTVNSRRIMAAVMVIVMLAALTGCVGKEDTQTRKKNKVVEIRRQFPFRGQRLQMGYMISVSVD